MNNKQLIEKFYSAFKNSDSKAMIECYHPEVEFSDPVFPLLKAKHAAAMWAMLCQRKADPKDRWYQNVLADETQGSAHWEAKYIFPGNGRPVHNKIDAKFGFRDGKIIRHVDTFDFYQWSKMALGPIGYVFGWSTVFQRLIQKKIRRKLDQFIQDNAEFKSPS